MAPKKSTGAAGRRRAPAAGLPRWRPLPLPTPDMLFISASE